MSGHSKWANIQAHKGVVDAKRSQVFTKLAKNILTSIRQGGGSTNLEINGKLRVAIEKARQLDMPKDNIDRLLKSFEEKKSNLVGFLLEGFGPASIPVMVMGETDNKNRTLSEIRLLFKEAGGSLGESGCVAFLFNHVGVIQLSSAMDITGKELELIDAGVQDIVGNTLYTHAEDLKKTEDRLALMNLSIDSADLGYRIINPISLGEEDKLRFEDFWAKLEEQEDVLAVFSGLKYE